MATPDALLFFSSSAAFSHWGWMAFHPRSSRGPRSTCLQWRTSALSPTDTKCQKPLTKCDGVAEKDQNRDWMTAENRLVCHCNYRV